MEGAWSRARTRATRQGRLKVHAAFVGLYIGLGLVLFLTSGDPRPGLLLWALLLLPLFALYYYLVARTGWGRPKDIVCPGCQQFIPFNSERCPFCGYGSPLVGNANSVQVTAHKLPKAR